MMKVISEMCKASLVVLIEFEGVLMITANLSDDISLTISNNLEIIWKFVIISEL